MSCEVKNSNINKTFILEPISVSGDTYITGGTYNEITQELELIRNDGDEINISLSATSVSAFDGYESLGGQIIDSVNWVPILFSENRVIDSNYTHVPGSSHVTINKSGEYLIIYSLAIKTYHTNNKSRSNFDVQISKNSGLGFNSIPGTYRKIYMRAESGTDSSSVSGQVFLNLNAGDEILCEIKRYSGLASVQVPPDGYSITIIRLNGIPGEKGEDGTTFSIVDKQNISVDTITSTNSPTYVLLDSMVLTSKLSGTSTYDVIFNCSRSSNTTFTINSPSLPYYAIEHNGTFILEKKYALPQDRIDDILLVTQISNVNYGDEIKVFYKTPLGVETIMNRTLTINGLENSNIIQ